MGAGGIIIIRRAMAQTVSDPLIHGLLPPHLQSRAIQILAKAEADWSDEETAFIKRCFDHAYYHC